MRTRKIHENQTSIDTNMLQYLNSDDNTNESTDNNNSNNYSLNQALIATRFNSMQTNYLIPSFNYLTISKCNQQNVQRISNTKRNDETTNPIGNNSHLVKQINEDEANKSEEKMKRFKSSFEFSFKNKIKFKMNPISIDVENPNKSASQHNLLSAHLNMESKASQSLNDVSLCLANISNENKLNSHMGSTPSLSCLAKQQQQQCEQKKQTIENKDSKPKYSNLIYENYPQENLKAEINKQYTNDSMPNFDIISVSSNYADEGNQHFLTKPSVKKSRSLCEQPNSIVFNRIEPMKNEENPRFMSTWLQSNQKLNKLIAFFKRNNESTLRKFKPVINIKRRALDTKSSLYVRKKPLNSVDTTVPQVDLRSFSERQDELNDKTLTFYLSSDKGCSRRNAICSRIDKFYFNRQLVNYMEHLLREDYIKNFLI